MLAYSTRFYMSFNEIIKLQFSDNGINSIVGRDKFIKTQAVRNRYNRKVETMLFLYLVKKLQRNDNSSSKK